MNLVVQWYKSDVRKQRFQLRCQVVTHIFSFFFNLVEKNLLRVKIFSKCCENGIASLRKRKLWRRRRGRASSKTNLHYPRNRYRFQELAQPQYVITVFISKSVEIQKKATVVVFHQTTKNLLISRCCFAEEGYKNIQRFMYNARAQPLIVLLIKPFVCRPFSLPLSSLKEAPAEAHLVYKETMQNFSCPLRYLIPFFRRRRLTKFREFQFPKRDFSAKSRNPSS